MKILFLINKEIQEVLNQRFLFGNIDFVSSKEEAQQKLLERTYTYVFVKSDEITRRSELTTDSMPAMLFLCMKPKDLKFQDMLGSEYVQLKTNSLVDILKAMNIGMERFTEQERTKIR